MIRFGVYIPPEGRDFEQMKRQYIEQGSALCEKISLIEIAAVTSRAEIEAQKLVLN